MLYYMVESLYLIDLKIWKRSILYWGQAPSKTPTSGKQNIGGKPPVKPPPFRLLFSYYSVTGGGGVLLGGEAPQYLFVLYLQTEWKLLPIQIHRIP